MTYPPQGPYGQQPDPYGQQQPQYGGGYQQPQYGGYDPNAQYGGGYGQYGGLGGEPPKNNKGPIIAVVTIVVLILAGVGITGFVAPGFFVADDKGGNNAGSTTTSTTDDKGPSADDFINDLVAAADNKDKDKLEAAQCSDATESVKSKTDDINAIDGAELTDTREESDTEVVATLNVVIDGDDHEYEATVVKDGGDWCWQDMTLSSGSTPTEDTSTEETTESSEDLPPATGDTDGEKFVQSFLDKLNAGDGAGAAAMSCSDSTSQADITEAAAQSPQLQMDPQGTTADETYVGADLVGTMGGTEVTGRTSAFLENGNWCIYTFFAS